MSGMSTRDAGTWDAGTGDLAARVRAVWLDRAGPAAAFSPAVRVAVAPAARICPPGWAGLVGIGGEVIATAPDAAAARLLQEALGGLPAAGLADEARLRALLPVSGMLGPAALAYADAARFRARPGSPPAAPLDPGSAEVRAFLAACDPADVEESGTAGLSSPAFAMLAGGQVAAVAGYAEWAGGVAHLCVLTAAAARGRGLAQHAASAAVAHALGAGLLPQWRAIPPASRRVAAALGFRELGFQVSLRLAA